MINITSEVIKEVKEKERENKFIFIVGVGSLTMTTLKIWE